MPQEYRHVTVDRDQDILILTISDSRIDQYEAAEEMGREMIAAVTSGETNKVAVDLHHLQHMSSVGYGPFLSLHRHLSDSGGRLVLCNLSEVIYEVFNSTRLLINPKSKASIFQTAESLPSAIERLRS